jgi:hypothetical protein
MSDKERQIPDDPDAEESADPELFARKSGGYAGGLGSEIVDPSAGPPPRRETPTIKAVAS